MQAFYHPGSQTTRPLSCQFTSMASKLTPVTLWKSCSKNQTKQKHICNEPGNAPPNYPCLVWFQVFQWVSSLNLICCPIVHSDILVLAVASISGGRDAAHPTCTARLHLLTCARVLSSITLTNNELNLLQFLQRDWKITAVVKWPKAISSLQAEITLVHQETGGKQR